MENKPIIPSALRSEIQRYHNMQINKRDVRSSLSPPVIKRSGSRPHAEEVPDQSFERTQKIANERNITTERNIVEEYRQKIKAKLSESASNHIQAQTNMFKQKSVSPTGSIVMSTVNQSQYNPLRFSPPRQDTLLTKQALYDPEMAINSRSNTNQPSPLNFSYQRTIEDQNQLSTQTAKQSDPLRIRYSEHQTIINSKSDQRTRSVSTDSHNPTTTIVKDTVQQNFQPTSSFAETNPLHYNSNNNPLQASSNGLKMSDSSMQSVYHRIQNLRKALVTQEAVQLVQTQPIQAYRATPSPKPELIEQQYKVAQTIQADLSPQMHSIGDSASATHHRRSLSIERSTLEHKRKRSINSNEELEISMLEKRMHQEMEIKFAERMNQIEEQSKQQTDTQYQDLLKKFNTLLFQFNQVTQHVTSRSKPHSRNGSQHQSKSQKGSQQTKSRQVEQSFSAQQVEQKNGPIMTYSEDEVTHSQGKKTASVHKIESTVSLGLPKSMSSRSNNSYAPIRSRNELITMKEIMLSQTNEKTLESTAKVTKEKTLPLHKKKFKYRGNEKTDWKVIDYPSLEKVNYFAHKQAEETKLEKEKEKNNSAFKTKRMIADFQKQISTLQTEKSKMQKEVAVLQSRLLAEGGQICCCVELKEIHDEERQHMETIVDMWREKASATAEHYQQKVVEVKTELQTMQKECTHQIKKMEEQQAYTMNLIINKQQQIEVDYHKRLQKSVKENRDLNRRVVEHRHALVQQRLNDL